MSTVPTQATSTAASRLRLLVAEDSDDDYELLLRELRRGGYEPVSERVDTCAALAAALERSWDLIVTDWVMPGFGGYAVLELLAARHIATPCIVVSGTPGEEVAVQALRAGALDFLSKDKPRRLVPVVQRVLREAADARARALAEQRLSEVKLRTAELEAQNRRILEANRLKSEFLANMSHELRTPLNAIIGFAELLHDGQVEPGTPEHREFLGDILASGRHLLQLINDILDLAKVESGKLEFRPEPVDLAQLVSEVTTILRTIAADKRLRIDMDTDPEVKDVELDPGRWKQVAYNYLSNALKFTPAGGRVSVRITPEGADHFRFEVEDTGIGISQRDQGRLFLEFQQLDTGSGKRHQGTGLGLALTRRIVEAQGGTVGVRSTPGQGSTFHAVLPRRPRSGT